MLKEGKMHDWILYTFCFIQLLFSRWVMSSSFVIPWPVACQAPLAIELSRQEYWSEEPFPSPGDLLKPGIKSGSPALVIDSLLLSHWGSPFTQLHRFYKMWSTTTVLCTGKVQKQNCYRKCTYQFEDIA